MANYYISYNASIMLPRLTDEIILFAEEDKKEKKKYQISKKLFNLEFDELAECQQEEVEYRLFAQDSSLVFSLPTKELVDNLPTQLIFTICEDEGIPKQDMKEIFDLLDQVKNSTLSKQQKNLAKTITQYFRTAGNCKKIKGQLPIHEFSFILVFLRNLKYDLGLHSVDSITKWSYKCSNYLKIIEMLEESTYKLKVEDHNWAELNSYQPTWFVNSYNVRYAKPF